MNRSHLSGGPFHCCDCGDGTGGGTFTPSDVTGLELQLDPELGTTVNVDGEVTAWADQSGNSHNVETDEGPGSGAGAFTLDPDAFGVGLSGLVAPVGGASLASAAALPVFAAGAARTVFVVAKVDEVDDGAIFISFQPSNGLSTTFALGLWNFNGNGTVFPYTDGITISQSTGEAPETFEGVTKIYAYRFDGSGQVEFSVNGLAFAPLAGTAFASETGDAGFLIGRFIGTSFQGSFKGTLGPIYGYNGALTDDEAARVITALSERYDVGIGIRAVTATAPLASSGGATPDISFDATAAGVAIDAPYAAWQAQTAWSIDESNVTGLASDNNDGLTDATPLLTIAEFVRRTSRKQWQLPGVVTVRWLSNATTANVNTSYITSLSLSNYIVFKGIPTVVQSGTLTAGTAAGAGNAAPVLEDTALASTWVAAGGISTSSGGRLIRNTAGTKHAWIAKDLGAKQARCSWASTVPETGASVTAGAATSFASGDAYEVVSLPTFPAITTVDPYPNTTRCLMVHVSAAGAPLARHAQVQYFLCSFQGSLNMVCIGSCRLNCCCIMGGCIISGAAVTPQFCLFSATCSMNTLDSNWNGLVNTLQAGTIAFGHGTRIINAGTLHLYDCTLSAIQITQLSIAVLTVVSGSGNTGLIVFIDRPGCKVVSTDAFAGFTATTAAAKPLGLVAATYDYADAIAGTAQDLVKDMGFYG